MTIAGSETRYTEIVELSQDACWRALQTRDARFDGRFVTAVRSTGIYCRPICPALAPKRENCLFLPCAAAAQEAGFRPCLRCRPEASPGTPAWQGTSATVSRALRLIAEGALDTGGVGDLAARLGVGDRHLRRLFRRHLGASPITVAQTRRLHFAKKLIDETKLSMAEVALSSGFSSVRRFNAAIRRAYGRSPRELRGGETARGESVGSSDIELNLAFRPPFHWASLIRFLLPRLTPGVESAGLDAYRRTVSIDGVKGIVEVAPSQGSSQLVARIRLAGSADLIQVAERLRRIFDLGADPEEISMQLGRDPYLAGAFQDFPGLRVPGAWDGFELAVRAIIGQQVSVRAASTLAGRLVEAHGEPLGPGIAGEGFETLRFVFPCAESLARADLTGIGLTRARASAISNLAEKVAKGDLAIESCLDLDESLRRLAEVPGVGEWTAQYIAMRALGEPDAFPATDLGLRRALAAGGKPIASARLAEIAEAWRPWRAYAAMALWMSQTVSLD
jgi:AraC family transcriptional regulator of adaptative response / DNA-3-methyladenine glycosylase II